MQLSASSYSVNKHSSTGQSFATITVNRTGDLSGASTVKYATSDSTDVNFKCDPNTAGQPKGIASRKCDYHLAFGRLRFAAGESSKQFLISIVDNAYVKGALTFNVTLSNPTGAILGTPITATITILDNGVGGANPIDGTSFFVRQDGRLYATPLLMVLVVIEATDVVFAVDSIPAVFGVTSDVFIVYTSNIFAVLGLRALCFLVASVVRRLKYLRPALALVLAFVGAKMLLADRFRISNWISLLVIAGLIGCAALISVIASRKEAA